MSSPKAARKPHSTSTAINASVIQSYANIMETLMKAYFQKLYSAPDSLYIMMATMGLESSFRVWPNGVNANHTSVGVGGGIGRAYATDPLILPLYRNPAAYGTTPSILNEGLSAKALMATMGLYHVRGTKESNAVLAIGGYKSLAEASGLLVAPGQSVAAIFTNDQLGASKSMMMGCMIMEGKLINRLKKNSLSESMRLACGDYLGNAGARDVLGTTPAMRVADLNNPTNGVAKRLAAAGFTKTGNANPTVQVALPPGQPGSNTKAASSVTPAAPPATTIPINGCTAGTGLTNADMAQNQRELNRAH